MALISRTHCRGCGFEYRPRENAGFYVTTAGGGRAAIGIDPSASLVEGETGLDYWTAWHQGRVGQISSCLCMECGAQFGLDLERDVKQCPGCSSLQVRSLTGAIGCRCPRCGKGTIESEPVAVS